MYAARDDWQPFTVRGMSFAFTPSEIQYLHHRKIIHNIKLTN